MQIALCSMASKLENTAADQISIASLPDDILIHTLQFISPLDNLSSLQPLCRRLYTLSNSPLLWKKYCLSTFQYWQPEHLLQDRLKYQASTTDWKALFLQRQRLNFSISRIFDQIVATRLSRVARMQIICRHGYDAKDFLIEKYRTEDSDPDHLSVRYYPPYPVSPPSPNLYLRRDSYFAGAILGSIHRNLAIQEWLYLSNFNSPYPPPPHTKSSLEKSLAAYDLFILHDQHGDLHEIGELLDSYSQMFLASQQHWTEKSARQKALALNLWLREHKLVGLRNQHSSYRNLRNCFLGQALHDPQHESLPIISSAIFCSIADRVELDAKCLIVPMCVHVLVTSPIGYDLDNNLSDKVHTMYLDPFGTDGEVPIEQLCHLASQGGMDFSALSRPSTVVEVTRRTVFNIEASLAAGSNEENPDTLSRLIHGHPAVNRQLALYAAHWALLILQEPFTRDWEEHLMLLHRLMLRDWPEDSWIMSGYFHAQGQHTGLHHSYAGRQMQQVLFDLTERPNSLNEPAPSGLTIDRIGHLRLGQLFVHRRYGWLGAIIGFYELLHSTAELSDTNFERESVSLPLHMQKRLFVKIIAANCCDIRLIAPENIEVTPANRRAMIDDETFPLAGKYFKRFDWQKRVFVSNVDEEYPGLVETD